ncbi:MAG: hypothetical protein IJ558_12430 [Treponema sp.]|nr:hypothetical protein [Treponema sp.]
MKRSVLTVASAALLSLSSCGDNSGLGASVDTEAPTITISYPPSSAVAKGEFILAGSCTDDKGVTSVTVTVTNPDTKVDIYETTATITTKNSVQTWQVTLNDYDDANASFYNGWQFADGTYDFTVVAKDGAGRTSGKNTRTLTIDNSAPVLVLTKPTSVGTGTAKTYGQAVQLQGSVSEMSNNNKINLVVDFYDATGAHLFNSTFSDIIDMSSANPLTIAQYYADEADRTENAEKWNNYKNLYGEQDIAAYEENGTADSKEFYFTVTVSDTAKTYLDASDDGVSGGNATTTYYRGTTDMQKLISGKLDGFTDFSVLTLRNYLNKTDTTYTDNAELSSILDAAVSYSVASDSSSGSDRSAADDTSSDSIADSIKNNDTAAGKVYLNFQINPLNNPTFAVSGYAIDESAADGDTYSQYNSATANSTGQAAGYRRYYTGSALNISFTPGLDETNLDTSTVSLYVSDAMSSTSDKILVWTWNEAVAIQNAMTTYNMSESEATAAIQGLTAASDSYRYTPTTSSENTDSLTIATTLSDLVSGSTYKFSVVGKDIDGQDIVPASLDGYGIWASTVAEPPAIQIGELEANSNTNLTDDSIINKSKALASITYTGTVTTEVALYEAEATTPGMSYELTFTDSANTSNAVSIEGIPTFTLQNGTAYTYDWSFVVSEETVSDTTWARLVSLLTTEGRYKLAVTITARSSGGTVSEKRSIIVDTKAPTVKSLSITNAVSGSTTINGTSYSIYYINPALVADGSYIISGSSNDNYELEKTTYTITGVNANGATSFSDELDDSETWNFTAVLKDFVAQTGAVDITVSVNATDKAGNTTATSTNLYLMIDATAPAITTDKIGNTTYSEDATEVWLNNTTLGVSGTIAESGSGVKAIYYQVTNDAAGTMTTANYANDGIASGTIYTVDGGSTEEFTQTINAFKNGSNVLSYVIVDNIGNVSQLYTRTVDIDTAEPTVKELASSDSAYTAFNSTTFKNTTDGITFSYLVYDADSGIDTSSSTAVSVTIGDYTISKAVETYGTLSITDVPLTLTTNESGKITALSKASAASDSTVTGYQVTVTLKSSLGDNIQENNLYTVTSAIVDTAGNNTQTNVGILSIDKTAPTVTVTKVSGSAAYVNGLKEINVVIKEAGELASASYQIFKASDTVFATPLSFYAVESVTNNTPVLASAPTDTATLTPDTSISFYVYTAGDNSAVFGEDSFVVRITATDTATNAGTGDSSTYIIDTTAPVLNTGDKIGTKTYVAGEVSWQNQSTLAISGDWTESGSGIAAMYYQLNGTVALTKENYASAYTGITYPVDNGNSESYTANISGFTGGANSLFFVAVDNVGNVSEVASRTVYVDTTAPELTALNNTTTTISTKVADKAISFTLTDAEAESGIDESSISVAIGKNVITAANSTYGTLVISDKTETTNGGIKTCKVTVTPSNTALLAESNSNALVSGSSYNVNVTIKDAASNETTGTVHTFTVDTTAPTVTITSATGSDRYVKDKRTLSVSINDTGTVASAKWALFKYDTTLTTYENETALLTGDFTFTEDTALSLSKEIDISGIYSDIGASDKLTDADTFVVCVKASDKAENESEFTGTAISSVYTVDTSAPVIATSLFNNKEFSSGFYNDTALLVSGSWTETGSGISKIYYQLIPSSNPNDLTAMTASDYENNATGVIYTDSSTSTSFSTTVRDLEVSDTANTLIYIAVDNVGNVSNPSATTYSLKVDNVAPKITASAADTVTFNGKSALSDIEFTVEDTASGIDTSKIVFTIGKNEITPSVETYGKITPTKVNADNDLKYTVKLSIAQAQAAALVAEDNGNALSSGSTYAISATLYDKAGNYATQTTRSIEVDTKAPTVKITAPTNKDNFVNSTRDVTVTINDVGTVKSAKYAIFKEITDNSKYEDATPLAEATALDFTADTSVTPSLTINITSLLNSTDEDKKLSNGDKFVVCVKATDNAENESLYDDGVSSVYTVDITAPTFNESAETIGGKAYSSSGTWFNSTGLSVTGSVTDGGSGIKAIYYQVRNPTVSGDTVSYAKDAMDTSNYSNSGVADGIIYTTAVTSSTDGTETYDTTIKGFKVSSGANELIYVVVDNVGNAAAVTARQIFVDDKVPSITAPDDVTFGSTITANGKLALPSLTFYALDDDSDISTGSISVTIGENTISIDSSVTDYNKYGTLSVGSKTNGKYLVTLAISAAQAAELVAESNANQLISGGTYSVDAKVYDKAGNVKTTSIRTLSVDTTAPTVKIAAASGTDIYVKDKRTVSITINDTGTVTSATWAIFAYNVAYDTATPLASGSSVSTDTNYDSDFAFTSNTAVTLTKEIDISSISTLSDTTQFVVRVKATDAAGNTSTYTACESPTTYIVDKSVPSITAHSVTGGTSSDENWFNAETLSVTGTVSDVGSGVASVYYQLVAAGSSTEAMTGGEGGNYASKGTQLAIGSNNIFKANVSGFATGENTLYYVLVDNVGNVSSLQQKTVSVDVTAPTVSALASGATNYTDFSGSTLTNGSKDYTFGFTIADGASGLDATTLAATIGGISITNTDSNTASNGSLSVSADGTVALTVKGSAIKSTLTSGQSYAVSVTVKDKAGNPVTQTIHTFNVDTIAPEITFGTARSTYVMNSLSLSATIIESGTLASEGTYYIYNSSTIVDTADLDTNKLASGSLDTSSSSITPTIKLSDDTTFSNGKEIKVVFAVSDTAGNTGYATSSAFTIDKQKPVIATDLINEKAYDASTDTQNWYSSKSLTVSGTWTEEGSGIAAIYYQLIEAGDSATAMTGGSDGNYLTKKTGVFYTTDDGNTESYSTTIKNFAVSSSANKLYYVAVDAVGNVSDVIEHDIYVDNVDPSITAPDGVTFGSTITANGKLELSSLTFYALDDDSDISTGTISVTIGNNTISTDSSVTGYNTYGTLTVGDKTNGKYLVTLEISADQAALLVAETNTNALASGSSYSVNATVYDNAGNSKTTSIRTLKIDTEAPEVTVTKVDSSNAYIKNTKSITASISDTGTLSSAEWAIYEKDTTPTDDTALASANALLTGTISIDDTTVSAVTKPFTINISSLNGESGSLKNGTEFYVYVRAKDGAGNVSNWRATKDGTTYGQSSLYTVDTVAPTLSGDKIGDTTYVADSDNWFNAATLSVEGTWTDASGASTMYYQVNGTTELTETNYTSAVATTNSVTAADSVKTLAVADNAYNTNISGFKTGTNTLIYVAVDAAGNVSAPVTRTVNVDRTAPTITADSTTTTNMGTSSDITLSFTVSESTEESGVNVNTASTGAIYSAEIAVSSSETITITNLSPTYGSIAFGAADTTPTSGYKAYPVTLTLKASALSEKLTNNTSYPVSVTLKDIAGNERTTSVGSVKADKNGPSVTISAHSGSNLYVKDSKQITVSLADAESSKIVSYTYAVFKVAEDGSSMGDMIENTEKTKTLDTDEQATSLEVTPTVDISSIRSLTNGDSFIIGVKATDSLGNESSYYASSTYTVDTEGPSFGSSVSGALAKQVGVTSTSLAAYNENTYFSTDSSLAITGSWIEEGSGIAAVYYEVAQSPTLTPSDYSTFNSFSTTNAETYGNFAQTLSGFTEDGTWYVRLVAVDNVGNVSANAETYTIKRDKTAPTFTESSSGDFDTSVLTNGESDSTSATVSFTFLAGETGATASGLSKENGSVTVTMGTLTARSIKNGLSSDYGEVTLSESPDANGNYTVTVSLNTAKLLAGQSSSTYAINATITDAAGNTATRTVHYLSVDKTAPTLTVTSPSVDSTVNKTITVTGSATDANDIASITLTAVSTTNTTGISKEYAYNGESNTINLTSGTWTATLDTTSLYNGTDTDTLTLTVVATDKAGNSTKVTRTATIDQKSDRPDITINGLTKINGTYVLQLGKNATISGTVTDDDSTSSAVVKTFIVSDTAITSSSDTASGKTDYTSSNGKWSFTPSNTSDGTKTVYFYIVDNGVDASGASTGTFYTGATTTLALPVLLVGTDSVSTETAFSYNSDSVTPVVAQPNLNYSTDGTDAANTTTVDTVETVTPLAVSTSVYVGGANRPYVQFIVSASDANKIAGFTLDLGNTSASLTTKQYSYGKATLALVSDTSFDSYTDMGSATTTDTTTTWTTEFIDLSDFKAHTGAVNLNIVAYDNSGMSGVGSYTFMLDNTAPSISISSPSSTTEQNGTNVTISGTLADTGLAGVASIKYGIPLEGATSIADSAWLGTVETTGTWSLTISDIVNYLVRKDSSNNLSDSETQTHAVTKQSGSVVSGTDIWKIPVYFVSTDNNGNVSEQKTDYFITYNPNADLPITAITYPNSDSYKSSTEQYAPLGGKINAQGTVSFAGSYSVTDSGSAKLKAVYVQLGVINFDDNGNIQSVNWDYLNSDFTSAINFGKDGLTVLTSSQIAENILGSDKTCSDLTFADSSDKYSYGESWWGIAAESSSFGTETLSATWKLVLNNKGGLDTTANGGINRLAIRACGVNSNGKVGSWDGPYYIYVDNGYPTQTVSLKQFKDYPSRNSSVTGDTLFAATADSEKDWTSDMYVRNKNADWYLVVYAYDSQGIKDASTSASVTVSSVSTDLTSSIRKHAVTTGSGDTAITNYYYYIPLNATTGSGTYSVSVTDADTENDHTTPAKYAINIDNTAPEMTSLTDTSSEAIAYNKLKNSNYGVQFGATTTDDSSGVSRIAYYFKRSVTEDDTTTETIELPIPSISSGTATPSSVGDLSVTSDSDSRLVMTVASSKVEGSIGGSTVYTSGDSDDESGLYGVWLSNATRDSDNLTTFTQDYVSDYAEKGLIRVGGIALIGGSYRKIESVSGDTVTFTEEVGSAYTDAFFAMAFIVDNSEGFSNASGTETITNDDGDGVAESIKKGTYKWEWQSKFFSDELDDGPIYINCASFDNAENATPSSTYVMIANNTPRLTKVFLATDLNGDGVYADSEFVQSSVYISRSSTETVDSASKSYLNALTSAEESATAIVTTGSAGDWKDSDGNATLDSKLFRMSDDTVVTFEYVSNYEGYGSGNNGLEAYMTVGSSALSAPESTSTRSIGDVNTIADTTITWSSASKNGIEIPSTKFYNNGQIATFGSYTESTSSADNVAQYLSLTLWDKTTGTSVGTADSGIGTNAVVFGSQYTVLNIPVYFDFVDDKQPTVTIDTITAASATTGHVEQGLMPYTASGEVASKLPSANFTTSGNGQGVVTDQDPKVSGTVVFTGTISDDKRINAVTLQMNGGKGTGGETYIFRAQTAQNVASYADGSLVSNTFTTINNTYGSDAMFTGSGWYFKITSQSFSQESGHTISWELKLDSSWCGSYSTAYDMPIAVTASDGTTTAVTRTQYVDIVPYITSVSRSSSGSVAVGLADYGYINRSKLGHYPVSQGETLTISGYNLKNSTVTVGSTTVTATTSDGATSFVVPARSGALKVTVNGIDSLNNLNGSPTISGNVATAGDYDNNLESYKVRGNSTTYYANDDRYLEVWNLGNYFKNTSGGTEFQMPVMTADYTGNLFASWGAASNGQIMFSYGVSGAATPIFNCYDQPAQYTAVAYDKSDKSGNKTGGASVLYMGEQQGQGGTYSGTGLSSSMIIGGAFVTNIPNSYITNSTTSTWKTDVVTNNPSLKMDNDNTTGFFNLANYDMTRRLGSYTNPKAARYGNYLHNIWYDSYTESLKYSVVNLGGTTVSNWNNRGAAIAGWVVLDGGYTGQDRLHEWTTATTKNNNSLSSGAGYHTVNYKAATNTNYTPNPTYFAKDIFLGAAEPKVATRSSYISAVTTTSLTMTGVTYAQAPAAGDTIALMRNDLGSYTIELRKITGFSDNTITWAGAIASDTAIDSATIYQGDLNVVGGSLDSLASNGSNVKEGSSGSSADMGLDQNGYPVVAYYDDSSETLRIAKATVAEPRLASNWVRTTTSLSCAGSVSIAVDTANNIHVVYKNSDSEMCYVFGVIGTDNKYTLYGPEVIDSTTSSDYVSMSVIETASGKTPCVSYLNSAGTAQSMKYAYRSSAPTATSTFSDDNWDYMIMPSLGTGHYALSSNPVSTEGRTTGWTSETTTVLSNGGSNTATPKTVQAAVAFKSKSQFETAYLLTEQ